MQISSPCSATCSERKKKNLYAGNLFKTSVVDPHPDHFGNMDPHPDPDPHQIKIRIRIKLFKQDPEPDSDPHQFADVKPKCKEYDPFLELFQGFEPFFEARIRIRIHIRVKSRIRINIRIRIK
jgi:hypothetical protein